MYTTCIFHQKYTITIQIKGTLRIPVVVIVFRIKVNVHSKPEIVETTLFVSRFCFLRVGSRISDIRAACNYATRNANFKSRISDIRLKLVSFLVSHFLCRS